MSLENSISKTLYTGNGVTREFSFPFKVWQASQVRVILAEPSTKAGEGGTNAASLSGTETDVTAQVSVSLSPTGGTVTFATAPAPGATLAILRQMPFVQEDRYITGTRFDPHEIEDALDIACAERQELKEQLDRSVKLPPSSLLDPDELIAELMQVRVDAGNSAAAAQTSREGAAAVLAETTQAGEEAVAEIRQAGESQIASLKEISADAGDRAEAFAQRAQQSAGLAGASEAAAAESARQAAASASETGMPLGAAFPYTGSDVPAGTLRADGATYTNMAASFPAFYAWVKASGLAVPMASYALVEGSCGRYGLDESTGSVRMPTLAAGVFGASAASQYGQAVEAGLPNITGTASARDSSMGEVTSGAFYQGPEQTGFWFYQDGSSSSECFDASRSSAVYGKSDTVTPSHVKYPWVIVVYNAAVPASVAEAGEFVGMLDGKADKASVEAKAGVDLENVTAEGRERVVGWGMPDYTARVILPAPQFQKNVSWTATFDCYVELLLWNHDSVKTSYSVNGIVADLGSVTGNGAQVSSNIFIFLKKGDVITYTSGYTSYGTAKDFAYAYPLGR